MNIDYGQQHLEVERACVERLGLPVHYVKIDKSSGLLGPSALTEVGGDVNANHPQYEHLPASFVPGRNLLFILTAFITAATLGCDEVMIGACETDFSGYPDCRANTLRAMRKACMLGLERDIQLNAPLMFLDKAHTFALAEAVGSLEYVIENSHTGYTGDRTKRWPWGYGPEKEEDFDPATALRAKGWKEFMELEDRTRAGRIALSRARGGMIYA